MKISKSKIIFIGFFIIAVFMIIGRFFLIPFFLEERGSQESLPLPPSLSQQKTAEKIFLIAGPQSGETLALTFTKVPKEDEIISSYLKQLIFQSPYIPKGTRLLGAQRVGRKLYIDLSREFRLNHPGGTTATLETMETLRDSILINFGSSVFSIHFLVEGNEIITLKGHLNW